MGADATLRLTAASEKNEGSGPTAGTANASVIPAFNEKAHVQMGIVSASGAPQAKRVILTFFRNQQSFEIGMQFPAINFAPVILNFGNHVIESDAGVDILLSAPALGTQTETNLVHFIRLE